MQGDSVESEPQNPPFDDIIDRMRAFIEIPDSVTSDTFITCDNDIDTTGLLSDNEILSMHDAAAREDDDIEELTPAIVSENDGFVAIDILKRYLNIKNIADFRTLTLGQIEDLIEQNVAHTC